MYSFLKEVVSSFRLIQNKIVELCGANILYGYGEPNVKIIREIISDLDENAERNTEIILKEDISYY